MLIFKNATVRRNVVFRTDDDRSHPAHDLGEPPLLHLRGCESLLVSQLRVDEVEALATATRLQVSFRPRREQQVHHGIETVLVGVMQGSVAVLRYVQKKRRENVK